MKAALLALVLIGGGAAISSCHAKPPYGVARLTAKSIGVPVGSCSATAVGTYTLLSASHCFPEGAMAITVDGKLCNVWRLIFDKSDHVLILLDRKCPQRYAAKFGPAPKPGDSVFVWGNPGAFQDLLRVGMVSGRARMPREAGEQWPALKHEAILVTGSFGQGDSGGGVFNKHGELVGVISFGTAGYTFPPHMFTGMIPLTFTRSQMRRAGL